jgi:hypothetical protein
MEGVIVVGQPDGMYLRFRASMNCGADGAQRNLADLTLILVVRNDRATYWRPDGSSDLMVGEFL